MMEIHICNHAGELLKAFAVGDCEELLIGRDDGCDIRIQARTVSREHCSIETRGDQLVLRDLGSSAGTYVNGQRVNELELEDGVEVSIGPAVLKFFDAGI